MNIKQIKYVELEITSDCNAACPGCARTLNLDKFQVTDFSLTDLKRLFPTKEYIQNKEFKLCGVLGDPIVHPECFDIVKYIVENNGEVLISTNAGYQTESWWEELGKLAEKTQRIRINFCIDGYTETNHIYRVNTKWNVVIRNVEAYAKFAPKHFSSWVYIVFDHNEHELMLAENHAKSLGFHFAVRTGMRNSFDKWVAQIKKKNKVIETKEITVNSKYEHSKKEEFLKLKNIVDEKSIDLQKTVKCKHIHDNEIFIASNLTLWPCCFLWDNSFKNKNSINEILDYDIGWNSLKDKSIDQVLSHEWYKTVLEESWRINHSKNLKRCMETCAHNALYHNEFKFK